MILLDTHAAIWLTTGISMRADAEREISIAMRA
jgi:PIN domain nuclease of toxin-antitoxin system